MVKNILVENLNKPEVLEEFYQRSPQEFTEEFHAAFKNHSDSETLKVWHARLSYSPSKLEQNFSVSLLILFSLFAGFIAKLPSFLPIDGDWFYPRFIPLVVIGVIILYFLKTIKASRTVLKVVLGGLILSGIYLAILPNNKDSASITMALVHLPMFLLSLLAISFMGDKWKSIESRLNFIRYMGEMGIYAALILLGGMLLTSITLGMFSLIGLSIDQWYMEYIVVLGLVSTPLVATFLYDSIQNRQSKFATILSNVFTPLFLITVLTYLVATIYQGQSPFRDRDFLIIFNGLLLMILTLTIFSISGKKWESRTTAADYVNVLLIGATLLVNIIALSAIVFRWTEFGLTVNRVIVTGANILIFIHLILLIRQYFRHLKNGEGQKKLESTITNYLPVYTLWSLFVTVVLPIVFWYK